MTRATKEKAEAVAKAQQASDEISAKAEREKETIKKQFETKITQLQQRV